MQRLALLLVCSSGCVFTTPAPGTDAGTSDTQTNADATDPTDGSLDASVRDAEPLDATPPDVSALDAEPLDAEIDAGVLDPPWWNQAWSYRRRLQIGHSSVTENLTDFPVLVVLNSSRIDYGETDGNDVRFIDENGDQLCYEVEEWDEAGSSFIWVEIDQISTGTEIFMYYGSNTSDDENPPCVFGNDYVGVWHLNDAPDPGHTFDDALDNHPGTFVDEDEDSNAEAAGRVAGAVDFNGDGDYVNVGEIDSDSWDEITVSAFINRDADGDSERIVCKATDTATNRHVFCLLVLDSGEMRVRLGTDGPGGGRTTHDSSVFIQTGVWHHVAFTWNATDEEIVFYADGVAIGSSNKDGTSVVNSDQVVTIANINTSDARYFDGLIDEVRISSVARTPVWMAAQYHSMIDDGFVTFGAIERP